MGNHFNFNFQLENTRESTNIEVQTAKGIKILIINLHCNWNIQDSNYSTVTNWWFVLQPNLFETLPKDCVFINTTQSGSLIGFQVIR